MPGRSSARRRSSRLATYRTGELSCWWKASGKDSPSHSRPGVGEAFSKGITTMVWPATVWPTTAWPATLPPEAGGSWARIEGENSSETTKTKTAARFTTIRLYRLVRQPRDNCLHRFKLAGREPGVPARLDEGSARCFAVSLDLLFGLGPAGQFVA